MNKVINMARQLYSNFMSEAGTTAVKSKNIISYDTQDGVVALSNCPKNQTLNNKEVKYLEKGDLNVACTVGRNMKYSVLISSEDGYSTIISGNEVSSVMEYVTSTFNNHYVRNGIDNNDFWIGIKMPQLTLQATSNGEFVSNLPHNGKYEYKISPNIIDDTLGKALDSDYVSNFDKAMQVEPMVPTWLKIDKTPEL